MDEEMDRRGWGRCIRCCCRILLLRDIRKCTWNSKINTGAEGWTTVVLIIIIIIIIQIVTLNKMNWIECCAMRIEIRSGAEESLLWQVNLIKVVTIIHVNPVIQLIQDISHWKPFFKSICFCLLLDDSPFLSLFHTFFRNEETMKWLAVWYRKGGWNEMRSRY